MLTNKHILLRALEPEDLEALYKWENNTDIWPHGITHNSFSRFALREYIAQSKSDIYEDKGVRFMIELCESGEPVGCVDLYDFDIHNQKAGLAILTDPNFQQQGIATQAIDLISEYAFSFLQIKQLYAHVASNNTGSLALFAKCKFEHTDTLKKWIKVINGYADVHVFQTFADI